MKQIWKRFISPKKLIFRGDCDNSESSSPQYFSSPLARPLVPIVLCFMVGIWAGQRWPSSQTSLATISIGLSGAAALFSISKLGRLATLAILAALIFLVAMAGVRTFHPVLSQDHVANHITGERQVLEGHLLSPPLLTPKGAYMILEAEQIGMEDRLIPCFGRVRLRVKDTGGSLPHLGDRLR